MSLPETITTAFQEKFGTEPTFLVRAPGRVNLIGEHTDYNDGFVLPMAIDRAIWIALRPRPDREIHIHSLDFDETAVFPLDHLHKESDQWWEYMKGVAWALQGDGYRLQGWEGVMAGDIPKGAGLSSSAGLEMATARACLAVSGQPWDAPRLARLGQRAENQWMGVNCGIMDQMISAGGVAGHALLIDCRSLNTKPVPLPPATAVIVMDTATRRGLVDSAYNERRAQCEEAAALFGVPALRDISITDFLAHQETLEPLTRRRARHVITENVRTLNAVSAMQNGDAHLLGKLMNESHLSLRDDFEVSSPALDEMVAIAQARPGCYGARMTGAGFGGCAVALVQANTAVSFTETVSQAYGQATGLAAKLYICQASAGAAIIGGLL